MITIHGYPDDMTLGQIKQAEQDKEAAYARQRQLDQQIREARWIEEDIPVAAEYGLTVEQMWDLFYDLLGRYEARYT